MKLNFEFENFLLPLLTLISMSGSLYLVPPALAIPPSKEALQGLLNVAEQSQLSRDLPRAESDYQKALVEAAKFGETSAEVQECEAHLATLYVLEGKLDLAEPHYKKARDIAVKLMKGGHGDPESYVLLDDLADAYQLAGASRETERCFQHCLVLRQTIYPNHKLLPTIEVLYGAELVHVGKVAEGDKYLKQGYARSVSLTSAKSNVTGQLAFTLANVYNKLERFQEAEKYCADSESVARTGASGGVDVVANIARMHGIILTRLNRLKEAELELKSAEIIHKQTHGVDHFEYAYDLVCMARIYLESHRLNEAETTISQALTTIEKDSKSLKAVHIEALELAAKIAKMQHHTASATRLDAQLKGLSARH
ncbi:MAG TPA: tetratricopeptide repeat protein [Drouetiella sp.]|jgi:tetratricopeptide (TPR) repeat protein